MTLTLAVAACGGGDDSSNPLDTTSTAVPGATTAVSTGAPTTTTLPPTTTTTTTTVDPFLVDILAIEPTPPSEPATGVNALLGSAPDEIATQLILQDLEDEGYDLTGVEVFVWPISGTGESLVVIEFGESAAISDTRHRMETVYCLTFFRYRSKYGSALLGSAYIDSTAHPELCSP